MATMLRHIETGEIFPMNPNLAMHDKMMPFDPVDPLFADAKAEEAAKAAADAEAIAAAAATKGKKKPATEEQPDLSGLNLDDA